MKKNELTKEFDGYVKDHPEIDYLSLAVPPERRYVILPKFTARGG